jgi:DNA repair protein RAD16
LDIDLGDDENQKNAPPCPKCFAKLSIDLSQPEIQEDEALRQPDRSIIHKMNVENWRSSTKIETLVEELTKLRRKVHKLQFFEEVKIYTCTV